MVTAHRVCVALLVGAMLAFGVVGIVQVSKARSRALAEAQRAAKPLPSYARTGGYVIEIEVEGATEEVDDRAALVVSTLRRRLDPDGARGIEVSADGERIRVLVPVEGGLSPEAKQWIKEFAALGAAGLWDEARHVCRLAVSPDLPASGSEKEAIEAIAAAHPEQAATIRAVALTSGALKQLEGVRNPVGMIERAVKPGVLELRITAEPGAAPPPAGDVVWLPIHKPELWVAAGSSDVAASLAVFKADPGAFFGSRGYVVAEREGMASMLVGNTPKDSLTKAQPGWSVAKVHDTEDQAGRPALWYQLGGTGGALMETMTAGNIERHLAIIVDGEIYAAPRLKTAIGAMGVIDGRFDREELDALRLAMESPLPARVRLVQVRE